MNQRKEPGNLPGRISGTVSGLLKEPETVIENYVAGRRDLYLNPYLHVLLFAILLAIITPAVVTYPEIEVTAPDRQEQQEGAPGGFQVAEFQEVMMIIGIRMNTQFLGFLNLLFIPVLSLTSFLFFRHSHPGYYRHLILNGYTIGQINIALLMLLPVWTIYNSRIAEPAVYLYPSTFLMGLLLLMMYNRYLGLDTLGGWLKAFSALIIAYFFYSVLAGLTIAVISILTYMSQAFSGA